MIKNLVNAIKEQAEHIGGIKSFKYEGADLINAQNNNNTIQVWVEDDIYSEYIVTKDLLKVQLNIDILDKVYQTDDKLEVHNTTLKIAIVLLKLLELNYGDFINVYDYSIMAVSKYTDDVLYGQRLSVYLHMPSPVNHCNLQEFIDLTNEYYKNEDKEIDIIAPQIDINNIDINPIKLKKNG